MTSRPRCGPQGGVRDDSVVADCAAALRWLKALPTSNGKVGIIGSCSGGRHAVLAASRVPGFDAVVGPLGRRRRHGRRTALSEARPVAPIDYTDEPDSAAARPVRQRRPASDARAGQHPRGRAEEARQELRVPPLRRRRARLLLLPRAHVPAASRRWTAGGRSSPSSARTWTPDQARIGASPCAAGLATCGSDVGHQLDRLAGDLRDRQVIAVIAQDREAFPLGGSGDQQVKRAG